MKNWRPHTAGRLAGETIKGRPGSVHLCAAMCLLVSLALTGVAAAIEDGAVTASSLAGDGWVAENVEFRFLNLTRNGLEAEVLIGRFVLSEPRAEFGDISIICSHLNLTWRDVSCSDARVRAQRSPLGGVTFRAGFTHVYATSETRLSATGLGAGGGTLNLRAKLRPRGWQAWIEGRQMTPAGMRELAAALTDAPALPPLDGYLDATITAGGGKRLDSAEVLLDISGLTGSNEAGTAAAERLQATISIAAERTPSGWSGRLNGKSSTGQLYVHPVFVDFSENPLSAGLRFEGTETKNWQLDYQLEQEGVGRAEGTAGITEESWPRPGILDLDIQEAHFPGVYLLYLQPFLVGTVADSLESAGILRGKIRLGTDGLHSLQVALEDLHVDDTRDRFALYGLDASLNWAMDGSRQSLLGWRGGYGYQIGFGAAELALQTEGNSLRLTRATRIPILDGAMIVNEFAIRNAGRPEVSISFDGEILQVGMRALTRALGWPPFPGSISGSIPGVRYTKGSVTVDGLLTASVFDGTVAVDSLRLSDPLGVLPELQADVRLRNLDLASLTSAFSFGDIEGRLDGDISNLRMLGFSPVEFDARLYSTPGDKSRHRISQQAIENISSLGGAGASAALSRGLLRFFESFAYDVIGWACVLKDEVCLMDGIAPAQETGYYIVRGKGLPSINVIGFSRRVSWPSLVQKLRDISAGEGPEIR